LSIFLLINFVGNFDFFVSTTSKRVVVACYSTQIGRVDLAGRILMTLVDLRVPVEFSVMDLTFTAI